MALRNPPPPCRRIARFATPEDRGSAGGFESRKAAALTHLREAWFVADDRNAAAIEVAIRALVGTHSACPTLDYKILRADNWDVARWMEFLEGLWWRRVASGPLRGAERARFPARVRR